MRKHVVSGIVLLLASQYAAAQNQETRINDLLAEIAASDLEHSITQCATQVSARLAILRAPATAILPFRDEQQQHTGLTEYLAAALGKKLLQQQSAEIVLPGEVRARLQNLRASARWDCPAECDSLAAYLKVPLVLSGRVLVERENFILLLALHHREQRSAINLPPLALPRAPGLNRLHEIICADELAASCRSLEALLTAFDRPLSSLPSRPYFQDERLAASLSLLAHKLSASLPKDQRLKIAVVEFWDLEGRPTQLGKWLAEELTAIFFQRSQFTIVERSLLQQVLREQALAQTGVIEIAQAQTIGRAAGADAIVAGTLSALGNEIKVNARMIEVRSGVVLAAAGESLVKTASLIELLNSEHK